MNHKSSFILLSSLVAVAATVLITFDVELTASAVFTAGLAALLLGEYSRDFKPLPLAFLGVLVAMIVTYLALVEVGKVFFFRRPPVGRPLARGTPRLERTVHRRAAAWSTRERVARASRLHGRSPTAET